MIMKSLTALDWIALVLLVVGGINWGLVGFLQFDLVAAIFGGSDAMRARIVYSIGGLCAVYVLVISGSLARK